MSKKNSCFRAGQMVRVNPEAWRDKKSFIGKIREFTQSGMYISDMLGEKRASATMVYYDFSEITEI